MEHALKTVLKKAAALALTLLLASFLVFLAFQLIDGDPARTMLGAEATEARVTELQAELGLDKPFLTRYFGWLGGFVTGDFGVSFSSREQVGAILAPKIGVTVTMSLLSFALIVLFGVPAGLFSARLRHPAAVAMQTFFDQLLMAVPPFVLGVGLSWVFGILLKVFTPLEFPSLAADPAGALRYLFFPALSLAVPRAAMTARMLRASVREELNKDYVLASMARGASPRQAEVRHVLKNALPPTVSFLAQTVAELVGGGVIVEQVFGVPGVGGVLVDAIGKRDYPVACTVIVMLAFFVILSHAAADAVNLAADPRRRGGEARV